MHKDIYKLIYYTGYQEKDEFELYDLHDDVEEMNDLSQSSKGVLSGMEDELLANINEANKLFSR